MRTNLTAGISTLASCYYIWALPKKSFKDQMPVFYVILLGSSLSSKQRWALLEHIKSKKRRRKTYLNYFPLLLINTRFGFVVIHVRFCPAFLRHFARSRGSISRRSVFDLNETNWFRRFHPSDCDLPTCRNKLVVAASYSVSKIC